MTMPASLRILERELLVYRRTWRGTIFSTVVSPVLFLSALGLGVGGYVDSASSDVLGGITYLAFLGPGLLVANAMQAGAFSSAWPMMVGFKWVKWYHAALATPLAPHQLLLGHFYFIIVRTAMVSAIYWVMLVLFGAAPVLGGFLAIGPAILTGLAFAAPIAAFTAKKMSENSLTMMFRFGITPLFLFSGTVFPISNLPEAIQPIAYAVPIWHGVELARSLTTGLPSALGYGWHLLGLGVWILGGGYLAFRFFHQRVRT
jgi:lipooligosaccharide transport system permease protein